jgi:hypothetical protein
VTAAGGIGAAGPGDGKGCRGPDKIWPGRGVGTGRAGTGPVRNGGCSGATPPAESGGLKGAGLLRSASSVGAPGEPAGAVPGKLPGLITGGVTGASCACVVTGASNSVTATLAAGAWCSGSDGSCRGGRSNDSGSATATEVSVSRRMAAPAPPCTRKRSFSATSSSMELECVFFSATPSSGNMSMMACEGTSSCLASSLIRILLINNGNTGSRCA